MHTGDADVFVTGIGLETCIGRDVNEFWHSLSRGRSGLRPAESFDTSSLPCKIAGEVAFAPEEVMTRTEVRRSSRPTQMLLSATLRALDDAGSPPLGGAALIVGTGGGGIPAIASIGNEIGFDRMVDDPFLLTKTLPTMAAAQVAQRLGITGPVLTVATACAASTDAMGIALGLLRSGAVDVALAAGVEPWLAPQVVAFFCKVKAVSTRAPAEATEASRPFDAGRDGMVPAEGAGVLVLERVGRSRGATRAPYGTLLGAASNCDAHHPVIPKPEGDIAAKVICNALHDAGLRTEDVGLVSAHGTSTKLNDIVETRALRAALGATANRVPITAPKSVMGHAMGACGVLEAAGALLALQHNYVPPTINLTTPDPECDLDYTPLKGHPLHADVAVSCNFGFGGHNSAVVLGRADG